MKKGISMIDLHVHSNCSDGTLTPEELVDYAIKKKLTAFALTDHDTVSGLDRAISYAEELKKSGKEGVPEVIPAIELSTDLNGGDVHVVGLYVNHKLPEMQKYLQDFVESRDNRNKKMCEKLRERGVDITYEELVDAFPGAVITRAHFARLLLNKGYIKSMPEAFDRFIGSHAPCYVQREKVTPRQAVELILASDGIPVLAHPILYRLSSRKLDELVCDLRESGLIGIEAIYSTYAPSEERDIRRLAKKYNLLLSGGSDFHGKNKPNIDLGTGTGKLYVPDEILDAIKGARKNILSTDMDGTLFLSDSTISKKMRDELQKLTERGHKLVFNSGRPLASISERIVNLGLNFSNVYVISNNGGLIYDYQKQETIKEFKLTSDQIRKIVDIATGAGFHAHSYTDKEIVGFEDDDELKLYRSRVNMPFVKTDDIAGFLKDGSFKVQIISLNDIRGLAKLKDHILSDMKGEVTAVFSNDQYLEILPKEADKGVAFLYLAKYLNIPFSHTYAVGDMDNDIGMVTSAAHGYAMKNGCEALKAAAPNITERDNDHDGILEIVDKYFK